jgi:hypothetical protein
LVETTTGVHRGDEGTWGAKKSPSKLAMDVIRSMCTPNGIPRGAGWILRALPLAAAIARTWCWGTSSRQTAAVQFRLLPLLLIQLVLSPQQLFAISCVPLQGRLAQLAHFGALRFSSRCQPRSQGCSARPPIAIAAGVWYKHLVLGARFGVSNRENLD